MTRKEHAQELLRHEKLVLNATLGRLAALLAASPNVIFSPSDLRIELAEEQGFIAHVGVDPENTSGALITLSLEVVTAIEAAVAAAGWVHLVDATTDLNPIVDLTLQWIILHEIAHWALGHIGYAAEHSGRSPSDIRLSMIDQDDPETVADETPHDIPCDMRKCMELQADFLATQILDTVHVAELTSAGPTRQLVTIAAGVAILLIQAKRERGAKYHPKHPLPQTRAANIVQAILGQSLMAYGTLRNGEVVLNGSSDEYTGTIKAALAKILPTFFVDLGHLAASLNIHPIFNDQKTIELDIGAGTGTALTPILRDQLLLSTNPAADVSDFVTEAGREFARLRPMQANLKILAAPYSVLG